MKKYNVPNYVRYKQDLEKQLKKNKKHIKKDENGKVLYNLLTREQIIVQFLPLVENIARKFSTTQQAVGVMSILDLIQSGNIGLVQAVERLERGKLL